MIRSIIYSKDFDRWPCGSAVSVMPINPLSLSILYLEFLKLKPFVVYWNSVNWEKVFRKAVPKVNWRCKRREEREAEKTLRYDEDNDW